MDTTDAILTKYEQHPIALDLMPGGMDEQEFQAFCADVAERGILMPVTLYEGKVLDGWHRYRASQKTGTPFQIKTYTGKDPAGYVASVNVMRRKLSSLQRALVGAKMHRQYGVTQREVCKKLGISNEVVNLALKAIDSKNTKLIKRIEADSDFSRGDLKEELQNIGALRTKEQTAVPTGPNSVFNMGDKPLFTPKGSNDTDGTDPEDDEEDEGDDLLVPKGKKAADRAARKPQATAAQLLADGFRALMLDEKETFLKMIWPEAGKIVAAWDNPVKGAAEPEHPQQSLLDAIGVGAKKSGKKETHTPVKAKAVPATKKVATKK